MHCASRSGYSGIKLQGLYLSFVDNAAAQWALLKGYSINEEGNLLVTLVWAAVTSTGGAPWFERVPSKANVSDSVSRGNTEEARKRGWLEVEVDLTETWKLLISSFEAGYEGASKVARRLCVSAKLKKGVKGGKWPA